MAFRDMLSQIAVILTAGDLTDAEERQLRTALTQRGFERHAAYPARALPSSWVPDGFGADASALIVFNPFITDGQARPAALFPQFAVEKMAHLLTSVIPGAANRIRVSRDAQMANALVARLMSEAEVAALADTIEARVAAFRTDLPVIRDLSRYKYRAKVELVEWQGRPAILKTFRPTARDARARELAFHDDIAPLSPVPARVLDRSGDTILFEYVEDTFRDRRALGSRLFSMLDLGNTRALSVFVRLVLERGWDPIDLTPGGNILIEAESGRLRAIDFEFAHDRGRPIPPSESYALMGVPPGADVAHPLNNATTVRPYERQWRRFTGLSLQSFLRDPPWKQRLKRVVLHPFWLIFYVAGEMSRRRARARVRERELHSVLWTWPPGGPG